MHSPVFANVLSMKVKWGLSHLLDLTVANCEMFYHQIGLFPLAGWCFQWEKIPHNWDVSPLADQAD